MKLQNENSSELSLNRFEQILLEHNTCCLCGTDLTFVHKTDFQILRVEEQAHCPCCNVRTRNHVHTLQ